MLATLPGDLLWHVCSFLSHTECDQLSLALGKRVSEFVNFDEVKSGINPKNIQSGSITLPARDSALEILGKSLRLSRLDVKIQRGATVGIEKFREVRKKLKLECLCYIMEVNTNLEVVSDARQLYIASTTAASTVRISGESIKILNVGTVR